MSIKLKKHVKTKPKIQVVFGLIIKAKRSTLGISQQTLADLTNLHVTYISQVERGMKNVSINNIAKFARAFECSMRELMPKETPPLEED